MFYVLISHTETYMFLYICFSPIKYLTYNIEFSQTWSHMRIHVLVIYRIFSIGSSVHLFLNTVKNSWFCKYHLQNSPLDFLWFLMVGIVYEKYIQPQVTPQFIKSSF